MDARNLAAAISVAFFWASPDAAAQAFYAGIDVGSARARSDFARQVHDQMSSNFVPSQARSGMARETGPRIFAGATLGPWLGVEVDYTDVGTIETFYRHTSVHGAFYGFAETTTQAQMDALGVAALARVPLTPALGLRARAGVARTRLRYELRACSFFTAGGSPSPTGCVGANPRDAIQARATAGLGFDYRLAQRWILVAGWDRYFGVGKTFDAGFDPDRNAKGKFDVDRFAIGLAYAF